MFDIKEGDKLTFDGETSEVEEVRDSGWGEGFEVELSEHPGEWIVFADAEAAGEAAREYWQEMADHDPTELRAIVGDEALIEWALGNWYAVGSTAVSSLTEWLDLWLDVPEEEFARYDGNEWEGNLLNVETGETCEVVLYRTN